MAERERVLVAMSGGVDSSVAAALLHEAGHEVVGVTLHLWDAEGEHKVGRCCAPEDRDDARRTCEHLGVPHYVMDERAAFREHVVEPFLDEYRSGRTPSPCVHCNRTVKLVQLAALADKLGCARIATGHYARILVDPAEARGRLFRGRDRLKDQSYFLFGVPAEVLARMVFPLGGMEKDESRAHARRLALPNADKPDSQELCFVPDGDVLGFSQRERGAGTAGRIVTEDGDVVGEHDGLERFTVGQRKNLGLGGGSAARYVLRVVGQDVVVGDPEGLLGDALEVAQASWLRPPDGAFSGHVRIRYRHDPAPATIEPSDAGFRVRFDAPQRAITPGQAAVVYVDDEVYGGGFIA